MNESNQTLPLADNIMHHNPSQMKPAYAIILAVAIAPLLVGCDQKTAIEAPRSGAVAVEQSASMSGGSDALLAKCAKILKYGDQLSQTKPDKVDAVHALGLLGDERAVPILVEHLENEANDNLRLQIVRALGWIGSSNSVPALEVALKDKYPWVRQRAATALKQITGKEYEYDKTGLPDVYRFRKALPNPDKS
jgi:hypothetical protein